jgi:Na+/melibiose symporter-like transporter
MTAPNENRTEAGSRRRYTWPWYLLGAVVLAIVLAVLWMSKEVERLRLIREANTPPSATNRSP